MSDSRITVEIKLLPHGRGLDLPAYATTGASGLDLRAAVIDDVILGPGARSLIPTGFAVSIPAGFEGQVRPRSGLALNEGITVLNAPGTIDSDYRGEVAVLLINLGSTSVTIRRGERIAQLVFGPVTIAILDPISELPEARRGIGGFGHTGKM